MRTAFMNLGLTEQDVAEIEAAGLTMEQVEQLYNEGMKQLQQMQQEGAAGPGAPGTQAPGAATPNGGAPADAAATDPLGLGLPAPPQGPPAWGGAWRQKFIDANVPAEIVQQLDMTGANGMDAAQLQKALDELEIAIGQSMAVLQKNFATILPEVNKMMDWGEFVEKIDGQTLAMVALSVQDPKKPMAPEAQQQVMSAATMPQEAQERIGTSSHGMLAGLGAMVGGGHSFTRMMGIGQVPYFFVPGYGLIRYGMGHDPVAGNKVDHNSRMEQVFAASGVASLGYVAWNTHGANTGVKLINAAAAEAAAGGDSLIFDIARQRGVDQLSAGGRLKAMFPYTKENRAVTGIANFKHFAEAKAALQVPVDQLEALKATIDPADIAQIEEALSQQEFAAAKKLELEQFAKLGKIPAEELDEITKAFAQIDEDVARTFEKLPNGAELRTAYAKVAETKAARFALQTYETAVREGKLHVSAPTGGIFWAPKTRGFGMRGAVMWRNSQLFRYMTNKAVSELQLSPMTWNSRASAAVQAAAASHLLTDTQVRELGLEARIQERMAGGVKTRAAALEQILMGDTAKAMNLDYKNGFTKAWSSVRPGPMSDALKAVQGKAIGSGAAKTATGMLSKFTGMGPIGKGIAVGVGAAAVVGGALLLKNKLFGGGEEKAPAEEAPVPQTQPDAEQPAPQGPETGSAPSDPAASADPAAPVDPAAPADPATVPAG